MIEDPSQLRCFCARHPLLAVVGRDTKTGQAYVHVKSFRQERVFTELVVLSGDVRIRCRECLRWHEVMIPALRVRVGELPEGVELSSG